MSDGCQVPDPADLADDAGRDDQIDQKGEVDDRIAMINHLLAQHAGGIELSEIDSQGRVTVKFVGMCIGCLYRPITMSATIRPALMEIDGVTDVVAIGSRIDEDARQRLEADIGLWWKPLSISRSGSTGVPLKNPTVPGDDES